MPDRKTTKKAQQDLQEGKSVSTAAGEFVREEMHHSREGKHSAGNPKQAIAIGLSKARQAGVPVQPPKNERSEKSRRSAGTESAAGPKSTSRRASSPRRAPAAKRTTKKAVRTSATKKAAPRRAKSASRRSKSRATRRSSKRAAA